MVDADYAYRHVQNTVIGPIVSIIIAVVALLFAIFSFIFLSWIVGLVCLGVAILFYFLSKLGKVADKFNQKSQQKFHEQIERY